MVELQELTFTVIGERDMPKDEGMSILTECFKPLTSLKVLNLDI